MKTIGRHIIINGILTFALLSIAVSYFFMISPSHLSPKYIKLNQQCTTCAKAQRLAATHFAEGKYQIVHWSLMDINSPSLKMATFLKRNFGIITVFGGCVSPPALGCYDRKMRELLAEAYKF